MHKPLVIAHRGYSSRYVENTQSAYRGAIEIGADIVESDARLSRDGCVFACHDATLSRIAGDPRAIADMTADELRAVALAGGERLSPLPRTLTDIAPLRPVLIDVKTQDLDIIEAIARDIRACGAAARVWIGVRDAGQMDLARRLLPDTCLLAFLPDYTRADEFERAGARAFRVWEGQVDDPAAIDVLRDKPTWITLGGKHTPCEVGDTTPERLARILALRPRGVLLNDPVLMTGSTAAPSVPDAP
ncbi:glycerophosphodiester phosphodiesterase [Bordetella genomosp. 8]|nr:glycerophosphodiester phosphodiesterase family protein [Bordetella genomosp. 8]